MKCPICKADTLGPTMLENDLPALICSRCAGIWIPSNLYRSWQQHVPSVGTDVRSTEKPIDPTWDTRELKLCPDCGHIMARYKTFPGVDYYLDRCRNCNGIWFDKNEWDVLVERNL